MDKTMTTAEARKEWRAVLRSAQRGTPVVITSHGKAIAAVVSIDQLQRIPTDTEKPTLGEVFLKWRAGLDPRVLEGPDPWANIRDTMVARPTSYYTEMFAERPRSRRRKRRR